MVASNLSILIWEAMTFDAGKFMLEFSFNVTPCQVERSPQDEQNR